jgi:hypothetical protein
VIRGICDTDTRLAARLYDALWVECGCCLFYRGFAVGAAFAFCIAAILHFI